MSCSIANGTVHDLRGISKELQTSKLKKTPNQNGKWIELLKKFVVKGCKERFTPADWDPGVRVRPLNLRLHDVAEDFGRTVTTRSPRG